MDDIEKLFAAAEKAGLKPVFGLKAQGHIPTITKMLEDGRTWEQIGKVIGWCPVSAKKSWDRINGIEE